ncbi:MAG: serine--tRNA ligase [Saprospiraceae bacterium]|nr:serine--tRNA ligase [Saprospiraceae bacterium]
MVELRILRSDPDGVVNAYRKRNLPDAQLALVGELIALDDRRKSLQHGLDNDQARANQLARQIGDYMKSGKAEEAAGLRAEVAQIKEATRLAGEALEAVRLSIEEKLISLPNLPHPSVPTGSTAEDNEVFKMGAMVAPQLEEGALPHWELARKYRLFDMEAGARLSGSGFVLYRGQGARLQRALIQFFLDEAVRAGYEEIHAPLLVNAETARATGQLPDKEGQMYYVERDELYLIPTAEVPVTNIYRDALLREDELPIKLCGYTPCFRREAGSYGAHVKGLNRVHQFDKVEIVRLEHPDYSQDALTQMLEHVEGLLQKLELPYRILRLCGGDLGFASALTFDFEVYSAAQARWLEVSSVSNFETFQSNRMKLRFKNARGESVLAHTLNGSALALARIVAALLENNQRPDGIAIPAALRSYTGFDFIR